ncbi:hypothetical protein [Arthrobacter sp. BE255]|uniref:hypothetical protein n=1 Tax=Arthrobacter sp. BE255 TaxID=2817721 RepID=UPI002856919F|nr:hypothetical protein [Arthrobacter sp. BE255]MDR7160287.1 hypothetical protein [Arthrobacter sp. BE255]
MSNPQEPYQPRPADAGAQQPPAPPRQPPAQPYGPPQGDGRGQYAAPQYGTPPGASHPSGGPYAQGGQHPQSGQYPGQDGAPGQYPDPSPFGLPGQPPAKDRKKLWTILGIAGGVVLLAVVGIIVLFNVFGGATNQARGLADGFTKLVIAGESSKAYDDYLDPALQEQLPKEDFIAGVKSLEMNDTCKPAYNDVKVASDNGINSADIAGVITCDGQQIDLAYRFEGTDKLKMTNIKLRPKT